MAEIMTNFTAGDMPGAQKPVKKAAAPKKPEPKPEPTPVVEEATEPVVVKQEAPAAPEEPAAE